MHNKRSRGLYSLTPFSILFILWKTCFLVCEGRWVAKEVNVLIILGATMGKA